MSGLLYGQVFNIVLPANKMLVMLAIADDAKHDGSLFDLDTGLIAHKTGYSVSQVRRIAKSLEKDDGLIKCERQSKGRNPSIYSLHLAKGKHKEPYHPAHVDYAQPTQDANVDNASQPEPTQIAQVEPMQNEQVENQPTQIANVNLRKLTTFPQGHVLDINTPHESSNTEIQKPKNAWYDVIQKVWGHTGGRNGDTEKMLHGTATKKGYREYNLEKPLTDPAQLIAWKQWYVTVKNPRPNAIIPSRPETVQSSIGEWQIYLTQPQKNPSSSGAVSPTNGDKPYSANNPANFFPARNVKPKAS